MSDIRLPFDLVQRLTAFSAVTRATIREPLGGGKDGTVFITSRRTAAKFHRDASVYRRERDAYRRLFEKRVTRINQFAIPKLVSAHDSILAIEMTLVRPPFIVDFASAILDEEWEDDVNLTENLRQVIEELFGERAGDVHFALERLAALHGIHMFDARPANITFDDN